MATMQCEIVSAEKSLFSGAIKKLTAVGTIGGLGIYPGHAPLLTGIQPGPVTLTMENDEDEVSKVIGADESDENSQINKNNDNSENNQDNSCLIKCLQKKYTVDNCQVICNEICDCGTSTSV